MAIKTIAFTIGGPSSGAQFKSAPGTSVGRFYKEDLGFDLPTGNRVVNVWWQVYDNISYLTKFGKIYMEPHATRGIMLEFVVAGPETVAVNAWIQHRKAEDTDDL